MLTEKVQNLSRRKTLILFVLLLTFVLQAGRAEAVEKKLTLVISQIQDDAGHAVEKGTATIRRKHGRGTTDTAGIKDGRLEHERSFVDDDYEVKLEAQGADGRPLEAVVALPLAEIQERNDGDQYVVNEVVTMRVPGQAPPGPSPSPAPTVAGQATPTPPPPTLEEEVSSLKQFVSDQGRLLQLIAGLLGALVLAELTRAIYWLLRGRGKRPLSSVADDLATIKNHVASLRQNSDAARKEAEAAKRAAGDDQLAAKSAERQERDTQKLEESSAGTSADNAETVRQTEAATQKSGGGWPKAEGSLREAAVASYKSLAQGNQSFLEPLYVRADVTGRPEDALGGSSEVFLQDAPNTGAPFILFADDSGKGYVFPNPSLPFSPALRPVFPNWSDPKFKDGTGTITPAKATRSGEGWKAEVAT